RGCGRVRQTQRVHAALVAQSAEVLGGELESLQSGAHRAVEHEHAAAHLSQIVAEHGTTVTRKQPGCNAIFGLASPILIESRWATSPPPKGGSTRDILGSGFSAAAVCPVPKTYPSFGGLADQHQRWDVLLLVGQDQSAQRGCRRWHGARRGDRPGSARPIAEC